MVSALLFCPIHLRIRHPFSLLLDACVCSLKLKSTLILKVSSSRAVSQRDSLPGREKFPKQKVLANSDALIYQYLADKSAGSKTFDLINAASVTPFEPMEPGESIESIRFILCHANPQTPWKLCFQLVCRRKLLN